MKKQSKTPRATDKWNFRTDPAVATKIRAHLKATGLKQGPFFAQAAMALIEQRAKAA
jgi:hypothetical protein